MAKKSMTKIDSSRAEAKATRAAMTALVKDNEREAVVAMVQKRKFAAMSEKVSEQNSVVRAVTVDLSAAFIAQSITELTALGARALAEWSQRTAGAEGHFAKNIGYYTALPTTTIGASVYILELATRNKKALTLSLGREIASKASNLLVNLGLSNLVRAIRYHLSKSIDEDQENQAEKNALLNKVAMLQKEIEAKK
jgi:hypothetical protein